VSKKSSILYLVVLACAVFTAVTVATVDVGALVQNTNSSATEDSMMQSTNMAPRPARRGRRGRRRARRAARRAATADAGMAADANVAADAMPSTAGDVQTDLSGTYTGKLKMTGSHEMEGDGTITITGNNVTIESGGMSHAGRIYAVTTRGYTGVTMSFADMQDTATNTVLIVMSRARKRGDRLTLTPVPGARNTLAFR